MSVDEKIEVEALGDARWARIERSLFERVEAGEAEPRATPSPSESLRWKTAVALVAAGAAAAVVGAVAFRSMTRPQGGALAVAPSHVETAGSGTHVSLGEASLDLSAQTSVQVLGDDARGITVVLERGRVECEVPPRSGRPPFRVLAGDVRVEVIGTHFAVSRAQDVEVEVDRGTVHVASPAAQVDVHAGEAWPVALAPVPSNALPSPPVVAPSPSAASVPVPAPAPPPSTTPTPRETYESASRLEATHPEQAIALYRDLAARGGPWGMNALFAQGRLELERGHSSEARRLLGDYVSRYPAGPNANDARQILEQMR